MSWQKRAERVARVATDDPALAQIRVLYGQLTRLYPLPYIGWVETPGYAALVRKIRALVDARTAAGS